MRAPSDAVVTIDRVKHVISETTELTLVMKNMTKSGFRIVTNVGAKLYHRELPSNDTADKFIFIKPSCQDELARIKGVNGKWLTRAIAQK